MKHIRTKRWITVLIALVAAAVLFTGCGSTSEESSSDDSQLAAIQEKGKILVGVEGTYPPFTYHDDDDSLTGFDIELAQAIAEKLGVEVEFVESDWDSLLAGIDSGRIDTVINNVTITDARKEKYDFTDP